VAQPSEVTVPGIVDSAAHPRGLVRLADPSLSVGETAIVPSSRSLLGTLAAHGSADEREIITVSKHRLRVVLVALEIPPEGETPVRPPVTSALPPGRAARLHGPRDLRLHDDPVPTTRPGEVLIRVTSVGLCGSDLHWFVDGAIGATRITSPLVLGHEFAGVIEDGPRAGERVAVDPADPCERCEVCLTGRGRLCPTVRFAGRPPTDGALRTRVAWPASRCHTLPDAIAAADVALLEVLGIAIHAIDLADVRPATSAGVYGCGPIGLTLIRALRATGVTQIVATDRLAHRVAAARESGATTALAVGDGPDPAASIPVDVAFECSGDDDALDTAVHAVVASGRVLLIGIPGMDRSMFPASVARRKEVTLQSVQRMEAADMPRAIALVASGAVRFDGLVSHRFDLEDAPAAFELLATRNGLKILVEQAWS